MKSASTNNELYEQYICPNIEYCRNITLKYIGDNMELEEIFSFVQTHLYKNIVYYNPNKPIQPFLHTCIKRYTHSLIKASQKEIKRFKRLDSYSSQLLTTSQTDNFLSSEFDDTGCIMFSDTTYKALKALNPTDRKLFLLHHIEGYSLNEISKTTGIDTDNIKQRLSQSLKIVRYKVTGCKPTNISVHTYLSKAKSLNNAISYLLLIIAPFALNLQLFIYGLIFN